MQKKYQIFISSTFADLAEERQSVSRSILDLGHIPAGMEMFPAADKDQLSYIKKVIDECDYYILIIGARYGSTDSNGVSYTQREFEYAVETGKTVLAFIHRDIDLIPMGKTDKNELKKEKLLEFTKVVANNRLVNYWSDIGELKSSAIISLTKAFSDCPQTGWVRADIVASQSALEDIVRVRNENDKLRREVEHLSLRLEPKFPDAAGLSTVICLEYEYQREARGSAKYDKSIEISMLELLRWIAPTIHNPSNIHQVNAAIQSGLKERAGIDGWTVRPKNSIVQDLMMHFVATGHVKMWSATTKSYGNVTAYQLTELGIKLWHEITYIRHQNS